MDTLRKIIIIVCRTFITAFISGGLPDVFYRLNIFLNFNEAEVVALSRFHSAFI